MPLSCSDANSNCHAGMRDNESACVVDLGSLQDEVASLTAITTFCSAIILIIIAGNGLVVTSILSNRSLHTTTNFIITSLAISDLLLGILVLPFSIWKEMTSMWGFGEVWCNMWLAADVWLSTASIYNVVAISFDRFMAVTQPLKYKLVSSTRVGRVLVSLAWVVSFCICLPPIVIWSLFNAPNATAVADAAAAAAANATSPKACDCSPTNNSDGYIIYSAMGSFFVPLCLIIAFNAGIYKAVLKAGAVTASVSAAKWKKTAARLSTPTVILRAHRGGAATDTSATTQPSTAKSNSSNILSLKLKTTTIGCNTSATAERRCSDPLAASSQVRFSIRRTARREKDYFREMPSPLWSRESSAGGSPHERLNLLTVPKPKSSTQTSKLAKVATKLKSSNYIHQRAEQRVAKTVSVVVGAYLVCWMPFAFVYLLQAYDICKIGTCIPTWTFTGIFWLGYANSAINPIIYALFSRDFRRAFKSVLRSLVPKPIRRRWPRFRLRSDMSGTMGGGGRSVLQHSQLATLNGSELTNHH